MRALFPDLDTESEPKIPGLLYRQNYVDSSEEADLVKAIDAEPWDTTWKRRRQPYGESYGKHTLGRRPIPAWAHALRDRLFADRISERPFDQMLVNEYFPGQGISMHRDYSP